MVLRWRSVLWPGGVCNNGYELYLWWHHTRDQPSSLIYPSRIWAGHSHVWCHQVIKWLIWRLITTTSHLQPLISTKWALVLEMVPLRLLAAWCDGATQPAFPPVSNATQPCNQGGCYTKHSTLITWKLLFCYYLFLQRKQALGFFGRPLHTTSFLGSVALGQNAQNCWKWVTGAGTGTEHTLCWWKKGNWW